MSKCDNCFLRVVCESAKSDCIECFKERRDADVKDMLMNYCPVEDLVHEKVQERAEFIEETLGRMAWLKEGVDEK